MKNLTLSPDIHLYKWQSQCLNAWTENNYHGLVDVVTGAGKTILAIAAICRCSHLSHQPIRVRIVLPKHSLIRQWITALRTSIIEPLNIGEWHGRRKDSSECDIMIYIVNSARHAISSHILQDQKDGYTTFLICDECHHYCKGENLKIFHFTHSSAFSFQNFYSLGLSATIEDKLISTEMHTALGEKIFSYNVKNALHDKHISPFALFKIQISLNARENIQCSILDNKIASLLSMIRKNYSHMSDLSFSELLTNMRSMSGDYKAMDLSDQLDDLLRRKQNIISMADSRIPCALGIIENLSQDSKILIFCERIRQAEIIYQQIAHRITRRVSIFHSGLTKEVQRNALYNFQWGESRILVSCRALDEGIDVPSCDVGIILSSSASMRQHIQRLGRILRTSPDKLIASVYYIYVKNQEDGSYLPADLYHSIQCDLKYLAEENDFINSTLENLAQEILDQQTSPMSAAQLNELRKCFFEGTLRADYMLDKSIIQSRMDSSSDKHQKNYWYACLLLHEKWIVRTRA